jgi:hypothetical protein
MVALKEETQFSTTDPTATYGTFINSWWRFFKARHFTLILEPIEGHGLWDDKQAFGVLAKSTDHEGLIAVLTRATIRPSRLRNFWQHVAQAAAPLTGSPGFIYSIGIGEVPWIKQATFSVWQSKQSMKDYAYKMNSHKEVIQKTRSEDWYSEEMFVRFKILAASGDLPAPLQNLLALPRS